MDPAEPPAIDGTAGAANKYTVGWTPPRGVRSVPSLPSVVYPKRDYSAVHEELRSIHDAADPQQVPGLASGALLTAVAMTEPGTGSDLANVQTRAIRDGDEYVINGSKIFITNAGTDMTFGLYLPPAAEEGPVPVLWYLSGLTCTHENAMTKAGAQAHAAEAGVDGLIIVDLPPEEDEELCLPALAKGLNFIRLATPTTDDKRLPAVLANTSGFVYYVSITGITGAATPENIGRLLPVNLSAHDVSRVMLGGAPWDRFDAFGEEPTMKWDRREGKYRYSVEGPDGGSLTMWVRPTDFAVEEVRQLNPDDDVVYRYETDRWKAHGNTVLPAWRRFVWPERDLDFSMDVGETQLNVELPEQLFQLPPPAGSEIIQVGR